MIANSLTSYMHLSKLCENVITQDVKPGKCANVKEMNEYSCKII